MGKPFLTEAYGYRGEGYRFDHSIQKASQRGMKLGTGTDCFAQLVFSLEDLARMVERGIYDLGTWIVGMKALPVPPDLPWYFSFLGFDRIPDDPSQVKERFNAMAKRLHPDQQGTDAEFVRLKEAREAAERYLTTRERRA